MNLGTKSKHLVWTLAHGAQRKLLHGKFAGALLLACAISIAAGALAREYFQTASALPGSTAKYMPEGALLYLEAKDFGQIIRDWNASPEKRVWVDSDDYSVFSKSRLFLKLQDAQKGFAAAAGLPPDMRFLDEVAGDHSALAVYDIGNLELLYVSRLRSAKAMQSTLWQTRSKFEPREANGKTFYVRTDEDSSRTVAFAVEGDYLILATREDLAAGALELMSGKTGRTLDQEAWFAKAVSASASEPGDLRMVMDLARIAVTPHFRSYWIQQNITETAGYAAGVSDLYRTADQYREERVLLRKPGGPTAKGLPVASATPVGTNAPTAAVSKTAAKPTLKPTPVFTAEGGKAVAESLHFVPAEYGVYRAFANPSAEDCLEALNRRILSPHHEIVQEEKLAPTVSLGDGETGNASDLETRIDVLPEQHQDTVDGSAPLLDALAKSVPQALLVMESSRKNSDGVLLHVSSAVIIAGSSDWDSAAARNVLQSGLSPGLSTSRLGVQWQAMPDLNAAYRLDGLAPVAMAIRGRFLVVTNDPEWLASALRNADQGKATTDTRGDQLTYAASFNHANERRNFKDLTVVLDAGAHSNRNADEPAFFSRNIASLSEIFSGVSSESMEVHEADGKVEQTVTYRWAR